MRFVTGNYFSTLSIGVARGRTFGAEDRGTSAPVAVINETTARTIWPNEDPVGQRVRFSQEQPWVTVIGVSRDTRSQGLGQPVPAELYLLYEQLPVLIGSAMRTMYVVLRTLGDPVTLAAPARS